ncbi:tyrosine-type recombinase/integrase [Actinoallomurus spadix]|uniref:Integrase n=1 Tax=Actinoallomurus spadix TaxID=79912 RepID=A0ABN0WMB2_9ACTN|nr:tyrosine-type recombinase/integrase [Actinoallomurus spadix]MCO5984598.1 tyrosine-type recombinase/integrase [Actinoallomurus spadix]
MTSDTSAQAGSQAAGTASDTGGALAEGTTPAPRRGKQPTPIPAAYAAAYDDYEQELTRAGGPLDPDTVRAYLSRVRQFLAWLPDADVGGDPLTGPAARDGAARDYRAFLLTVAKRKASTVNAHLTAIDDFFRRLGLGPAAAKRQELPQAAPRALSERGLTRWLRAAERASARDRALAFTELYAGTRGGETVALDLGDVRTSARKGHLIIRYGKNGKYREVPLHPKLRTALDDWRAERASWPAADTNPALFLNARGGRLSTRGAYDILKAIAEDANLEVGIDGEFTPHTLRHSAGTIMVRSGEDIVVVAELLGHSVETARRYSLPTEHDKQRAIRRIPVDE